MTIIGEAFLSASVTVLIDRLASRDLLNFARRYLAVDLNKWKENLMQICKVLDDAEERQITNRFVEDWLRELKNLTYDVEDILDELATEVFRRNVPDESPVWCSTSIPRSITFKLKMAPEIKEINDKFGRIVEQKKILDLKENLGGKSGKVEYQRIPATSLNETHIYGRESDKEAILDMLLKDEGGSDEVPVISIIGMGGMGKTTLAQLVFNGDEVKNHFDIKAWACISEDFDIARVTKALLLSIDREVCNVNDDLNTLQVKLKERLAEKKFLIVLDDVWHENYDDWTKLRLPFQVGSSGSKIVITTRNNSVALMVGTHSTYQHQLKELSYDNCLSVFTYHSLGKADFNEHQDLKDISEKIVKRCQGLPLAAKTLGGLLRGKVRSKDWEDVLNSKIWDLPEKKGGILPALRVSYYYLSPHLKRCFAYCSIFPKDYLFEMKEIILLWMAEGFLQTDDGKKEAEEKGEDVFEELYSRSFFQQFSSDSSRFVMHDLIHDLAQWVVKDFCFRVEDGSKGEKQSQIPKNLRHLSYINDTCDNESIKKFEAHIKSIRTLLVLPGDLYPDCDFLNWLPQLRRLRLLSLKQYDISELPNTIGDLEHLRYLDISYTEIENLPDSINKLYNLETLKLQGCAKMKKLCSDVGNLINLRHIYISYAWEGMPLNFGRLTCLRTLPRYVVSNDISLGLKQLKNLTHLQGKLHISGLEKVNDVEDAKEADFIGKKNLRELELVWDSSSNCSRNFDVETQVLDMLQPYQKLEKLTIRKYGGTKLPSWLGNTRLKRVSIENCPNLIGNFPQHLPSLESLYVKECKQLQMLVPSLPKQCEIEIANCKDISWSTGDSNTLNLVVLSDISRCVFVAEKFLQGPSEVIRAVIVDNKKPTCFWQIGTDSLYKSLCNTSMYSRQEFNNIMECMREERKEVEQGLACRLQYLALRNCECLIKLPQVLHSLSFLRGLSIEGSPQLTSIPDSALPSELKFIEIKECNALESLPKSWMQSSNTSLEIFHIAKCDSLRYIARVQLPPNLKHLLIHHCSSLLALVDEEEVVLTHEENVNSGSCSGNFALDCSKIVSCQSRGKLPGALKYLQIYNCPKLEYIAESFHGDTSLKAIRIKNCENLKSLPNDQHNLSHLEVFTIFGCKNLVVAFPEWQLPSANLRHFHIHDCEKVDTLPSGMNNLTSLQKLSIENCRGIVSIPEDGFPTNITSLRIRNVNICNSLFEWGLHRLSSLKALEISGGCPNMMSFPQEEIGMMLPTSLTYLHISEFPNLERLSSSIQNLTSLKKLIIRNCPKLESFPENGLPVSLPELQIEECPLLKQNCKNGGPYWPMIANIDRVQIDRAWVVKL